MISSFDLNKLRSLLRDFHQMTGLRITIFDDTLHEIVSYPEEIAPICKFIRQNKAAADACRVCDVEACRHASRMQQPYVYRCHAGLTEAAAPVFLGGIPIAFLLFGHLFSYPSKEEGWDMIRTCCLSYDLDVEKLHDLVKALPVTEKEYILSASHILQAVASYLCMDRMVMLHRQELPARIDEYISTHFTEDLTSASICAQFGIGRTQLYKIARQNYGCGIADRIRQLRIDLAKELLTRDDPPPLSEIAARCGFSDYNYFITVFKRLAGMPPGKYRRQNGG